MTKDKFFDLVAFYLTPFALLMSVALCNGFPLVFADTTYYLDKPENIYNFHIPNHPIFYNWIITFFGVGYYLWPTVVFQAALGVHLINRTATVLIGRISRMTYLLMMGTICLGSSVAWHAGQLMPDIFAGYLIMPLVIQGYGTKISAFEKLFLVTLTIGMIACHYTYLPIVMAGAVTVVFLERNAKKSSNFSLSKMFAPCWLSVMLATITVGLSCNWYYTNQVTLAPVGHRFLFARLLADGSAKRYLEQYCITRKFRTCGLLQQTFKTPTDVLYGAKYSLQTLFLDTEWREVNLESRELVVGTLITYPLQVFLEAAKNFFAQLFTNDSAELYNQFVFSEGFLGGLRAFYPTEVTSFIKSRQYHHGLYLNQFDFLHLVIHIISITFLAISFWVWRSLNLITHRVALIAMTMFMTNAFLTGALSTVVGRYGGRIIWIFPFIAFLTALEIRGYSAKVERVNKVLITKDSSNSL